MKVSNKILIAFLFIICSSENVWGMKLELEKEQYINWPGIPVYFRIALINNENRDVRFLPEHMLWYAAMKVQIEGPVQKKCGFYGFGDFQPIYQPIVLHPGERYQFWLNLSVWYGVGLPGHYRVKFIIDTKQHVRFGGDAFHLESDWIEFDIKDPPAQIKKTILNILQNSSSRIQSFNEYFEKCGLDLHLSGDARQHLIQMDPMNPYLAYSLLGVGLFFEKEKLSGLFPLEKPSQAYLILIGKAKKRKDRAIVYGCENINENTIYSAEYFAHGGIPKSYVRSKIAECLGFYYLKKKDLKKARHYFLIGAEKLKRSAKMVRIIDLNSSRP